MYTIKTSNKFEKDFIRCLKRKYNLKPFEEVISQLEASGKPVEKFKPHKLSGKYKGFWECHIKPDWLLIWKLDEKEKDVILTRTGSHSDLFE